MIEKKISNEELEKVRYSRLATNPGARTSRGESAMSGEKLKERMDEPFKLFQQKFNALVALVGGDEKGDSLIKHIPTGIGENHTLADMISDVISESAEFASYLSVGELTLLEKLVQIDKVLKGHDSHIADRVNPHGVTAKQLGLERVDNTSDEEKPLSAAVRAAFAALGGELSAAEAELIDRISQALISAKFYADDTKVGKVGDQVINGGLSISGDLLVGGDTFAKQIESLEVGDAVIIANADGVLLSELSGYVIRVNGDSAYAIVYDPADDCVKIGLGTYNSETKLFVFLEGEAQVLATRGAIADGHIPVWNDVKKIFEDSGKSADKVVERGADIPNGEIPVIKDGKLIGSGKTASSFASKDSAQVVANALKGSASGEIVSLKDVSPVEHDMRVNVSSKNLFYINATKKASGFGIEYDLTEGKSSFIFNGTSKRDASFNLSAFTLKAGTYTVSIFGTNTITTDMDRIFVRYTDASGTVITVNSIMAGVPKTFTLNSDSSVRIDAVIASNSTYSNKEVSIQIEKGTTATTYTPYIADIEAVKLRAQGKNLINSDLFGSLFEKQEDGSYLSTEKITNLNCIAEIDLPADIYTMSFYIKCPVDCNYRFILTHEDETKTEVHILSTGDYIYKSVTTNGKAIKQIRFSYNAPSDEVQFKELQIELGTTATEYELCKEPVEYTVNPDGTVDGVKSIAPATTLTTDTEGVLIEVEYNKDINKAFAELQQAIISLGGNV